MKTQLSTRRRKIALAAAAALVLAVPIQATSAGAEESVNLTLTINVDTYPDPDPDPEAGCDSDYIAASWSPAWTDTGYSTTVFDGFGGDSLFEELSFWWSNGSDECGASVFPEGSVSGVITFDGAASGWTNRFDCSTAAPCALMSDGTTHSPPTADVEIDIPADAVAGIYTATVSLTWTP